jgi:hypothetical protein
MGSVCPVPCHLIHRSESLEMTGLFDNKSAFADVVSTHGRICNHTDNENRRKRKQQFRGVLQGYLNHGLKKDHMDKNYSVNVVLLRSSVFSS